MILEVFSNLWSSLDSGFPLVPSGLWDVSHCILWTYAHPSSSDRFEPGLLLQWARLHFTSPRLEMFLLGMCRKGNCWWRLRQKKKRWVTCLSNLIYKLNFSSLFFTVGWIWIPWEESTHSASTESKKLLHSIISIHYLSFQFEFIN